MRLSDGRCDNDTARAYPDGMWGVKPGVNIAHERRYIDALQVVADMYGAKLQLLRVDNQPVISFASGDGEPLCEYMSLDDLLLFESMVGMAIAELGSPAPEPAHFGWRE